MNHYRQMYNRMLSLKFLLLDGAFTEKELFEDEFKIINQHIKELDELATEIPTTRYEQFITGNEKHLQNEV